jgi:hypothetical protein
MRTLDGIETDLASPLTFAIARDMIDAMLRVAGTCLSTWGRSARDHL